MKRNANILTKTLSLVLCIAVAIPLLTACANDGDKNKPIDAPINSESNAVEFVDADYDGEVITFLSCRDEATDYIDHYIDNEELNGEPINDAVIDRNRAVEEKYNVVIERQSHGAGYASQAAKAGTVDFHMVYDCMNILAAPATEGVFYDFNQMPTINFDQSYWVPSMHDGMTVADKMLIAPSAISMTYLAWAYFIFFNKSIIEDLNYTLPYEYVERNEWTYDVFLEMVLGAELDANGDTLWTTDDRYGAGWGIALGNLISWTDGTDLVRKNDDGTYTLLPVSEKVIAIYNKYSDTISNSNSFATNHDLEWADAVDQSAFPSVFKARRYAQFGEGHTLFCSFSMDMTHELVNMEDDYGVAPNPKYNSAQESYYHGIDYCTPMFSIMKQVEDLDMLAVILEYMAYESEQRLLPAFYEQTVKTKRMKDLQGRDERMLDIIRGSIYHSALGYYGPQSSGSIINDGLSSGNWGSVYKKYKDVAQKQLDDVYDFIAELDVNK